tara:strand:- start:324 stop:521 length:198 start_codon:yes stop_codon:yes gene_type:complete
MTARPKPTRAEAQRPERTAVERKAMNIVRILGQVGKGYFVGSYRPVEAKGVPPEGVRLARERKSL